MNSQNTIRSHGFLSVEIEQYREQYLKQFAAAFDKCRYQSMSATATLYEANISWLEGSGKQHELLAVAFWCRCLSACQGAILMAERGMAPEAGILLRTGVEFLFFAAALLVDPSIFESLADGDQHSRLKQAKGMLKDGKAERTLTSDQLATLNQLINEIGTTKPAIDAYSAAEKAGLSNIYSNLYRGLSLISSHATLSATNSVIKIDENKRVQLFFGPSPENLQFLLGLIETCMATGAQRLQSILKRQDSQ